VFSHLEVNFAHADHREVIAIVAILLCDCDAGVGKQVGKRASLTGFQMLLRPRGAPRSVVLPDGRKLGAAAHGIWALYGKPGRKISG